MLAFLPVRRELPGYGCQGTQGAWSKSDGEQQCHSESNLSSHCLIYPDLWINHHSAGRKLWISSYILLLGSCSSVLNSGVQLYPVNGMKWEKKLRGAPRKYTSPSLGLTAKPQGKKSVPFLSSLPLTTGSHSGQGISTDHQQQGQE